jgi:hypothetical protein
MYSYQDMRPQTLTDEGQRAVIKTRDRARMLCEMAGCCSLEALIYPLTGDTWLMLAVVDRVVELGDLRPVVETSTPAAHARLFRWSGTAPEVRRG